MEQAALLTVNPRIHELDDLIRLVNGWKLKSDRIVFTNGCFDIIHRGHLEYLEEAAGLGDRLIVGLNSDASVLAQGKGDGRPYNNEFDRAALLAGLRVVDAVILFSDDTPLELIKALKPDVLVKGGDWAKEDIVGAKEVEAYGGEVHSLKLVDGYSTTLLVSKIQHG
jgi:rfaE bifunctional protein nucleotidyltransferase chain/domain